jgi:hypothetical protein
LARGVDVFYDGEMRKLIFALPCVALTLALTREARAWGVHTGDTIGTGDNLIYGEAGWPGVSAGFAHGLNDRLEIGGRLDTYYGVEGTPHAFFGLGFAATIRYTLVRSPRFSAEVHVFPGFKFDFFDPAAVFGFNFPIGAEAGYHITKQATVSAGFDLGLYGAFTSPGYFCVAPMGGPGFEYHLDDHITFGLVTRFGGAAVTGNAVTFGDFAFRLQGFFAYRM